MPTKVSHPLRVLVGLAIVIAALYTVMGFTHSWTPKLGLDLRGGTTVTLTARNTDNQSAIDPTSLNQAKTIIQQRVDSLGVGESEVSTSGSNQIIVSVPNVSRDDLVARVGQTALLRFRIVYASEAATGSTGTTTQPSSVPTDQATSEASTEPSTSASSEASSQPSSSATGNGRPAPMLPTAPPAPPSTPLPSVAGQGTDQTTAINWQPTAAQTATFETFTCDPNVAQYYPDVADQPLYACDEGGTTKYLLGPTVIEGNQLSNASAGLIQNGVGWQVNLSFNSAAADLFNQTTTVLSQRQSPDNTFGVVLDGKVITTPSVSSPIPGGQAQITGSFTQESAQNLANQLKYGALPLAFTVSSVDNVSATLGGEQLHAGIVAGIIGLALVVLYCFLYYRGLGIVVISSLVIAAAVTYAAMVLLGASAGFALSLPGIAGAIVAIGVTADSFVIYFERIRDEVREGRSLRSAVETGWRRARQTVLIADAVSMLSALILFILAIGAVKGFAFTLGLTTLIDVLVVFTFTKPVMTLLARTKFFGHGHKLSGLDPNHLGVKRLPGSRSRIRGSAAPDAALARAEGARTDQAKVATAGGEL